MKKRIPTAICLILIITPCLIFDKAFIASEILFAILALIASYELFRLTSFKEKPFYFIIPSLTTVINYLLISQVLITSPNILLSNIFYPFFIIIYTSFLFSNTISLDMKKEDKKYFIHSMLYPGIGFGAVLLIRNFGVKYVLFIFLITAITDCFAYFTGMLFGSRKLAPAISPKKTIEGLFGGIFFSMVSVVPIFYLYDRIFKSGILGDMLNYDGGNVFQVLIKEIGNKNFAILDPKYQLIILIMTVIVLSLLGQIGDLYASKLKREKGIKDYSNIFPGHGGVLDRFDSLMFVAPMFSVLILLGRVIL